MKYAENPYVDVEKLAEGVWSILSPGDCPTLCYLVEGADKAMLIDTGFGVGDTKALCERLAPGKELIVVDTHSHGDHVLGNYQFDKVYIHALDVEGARRVDEQVKAQGTSGENGVPYADYELVPVHAGDVFDLGGGHEVEVLHTPGHTPGGIVLLEEKRRILFTGDSLVRTPTLIFFSDEPLCNVESYREYLLKLQARKGEFDALYPGHFETPQPVAILDDMIVLCDRILENPEQFGPWQDPFGDRFHARLGNYGKAFIAYNLEHVYKKK